MSKIIKQISTHVINQVEITGIPKNKRLPIPKALKEQVWVTFNGQRFKNKCYITWCKNIISVFTFECGHNIPFSKGGETNIKNLRPICSCCNRSMGNRYTIDQWNLLKGPLHKLNKN